MIILHFVHGLTRTDMLQHEKKPISARLWIYGLLVLSMMAVIFLFSSMPARDSSDLSGQITSFVLHIVYPDYENLTLQEQAGAYQLMHHLIRKGAHFSEYALLGVFLALFFNALTSRFYIFYSFLTAVLYAISDEWHQSFIEGRGPGVTDVLIDSAGALTGILIVFLCMLIKRGITKSKISHRF